MSKHTPAPWFTEAVDNDFAETIRREALTASGCIMSGDGDIAYVAKRSTDESTEESEANAAHIVKCVNERDELVAAFEKIEEAWEDLRVTDIYGIDKLEHSINAEVLDRAIAEVTAIFAKANP